MCRAGLNWVLEHEQLHMELLSRRSRPPGLRSALQSSSNAFLVHKAQPNACRLRWLCTQSCRVAWQIAKQGWLLASV